MTDPLAPIDDLSPSGPDLEYDPDFLALELAAAGRPERQSGDARLPAQDPDWKAVQELGEGLLARSKDLRVAVQLARAGAAIDGLPGLLQGWRLVRGLLETFWADVHPRLDPDDDDDPTMRLNAVAALAHPDLGGRALRYATWLHVKGARLTVRQALAGLGLSAALPDGQPSPDEIDGMVRAAAETGAGNVAREALVELRAIAAVIERELGASNVPDFSEPRRLLGPLAERFDQVAAVADPADDVSDAPGRGDPHAPAQVAAGAGGVPGAIRSREDALRALDRVCEYLERAEPANPASLLIRRAQRMVNMGFLDIMQELAPEAVGTVSHILGTPRNDG
jgi:type VI secretion system protein ImpA